MKLHPKILELKQRASAINYSSVSVNERGELEERESLLDQRIVEGYGVIWGSRNLHGEKFVKGCFAKSIKDNGPDSNSSYKIKFRDEHGRACSLFAELIEDEIGLYFKTKPLDDVEWANDVITQLRSGTLNNFSIGFNFVWDKVEWDESDDSLVALEVRLMEISVVSVPSDMNTFAIRSIGGNEDIEEYIEDFITSLPRKYQLQARKIFAFQKSLINENEPFEQRDTTLDNDEPTEAINYNYLIENL